MKVLVVEDEILTREEILDYVLAYFADKKIESIEVLGAESASEAIKLANANDFDMALLDIEMHQTDGLELASKLYERLPNIKIAFITAYNHFATEAFEVYAVDYVLKPIRVERLYKCLDKLVGLLDIQIKKATVRILSFGKFEVFIGEERVKWKRSKSREVLAYLVMHHGQAIHKEKLCDVIFSDMPLSKALVNLHTSVSHIRKLGINIHYYDNAYEFRTNGVKLDLVDFENKLKHSNGVGFISYDCRLDAIKLYKGHLYEEEGFIWAMAHQAYLHNQLIQLKRKLT